MSLTVSVVIPCHNAAPFLPETLASIGNQTRPVDEVILVDDGSTDGSGDVARAASTTIGVPLRVIEQPNGGVGAARNSGIAAARGDVVALLDADDLWHPEKTRKQVTYLQRNPEVGAVVSSWWKFTGEAGETRPFLGVTDELLRNSSPSDFLIQKWINQSALMVRAEILRSIPYPTYSDDAEDLIQSAQLRMATPIGAVPEALVYYRQHPSQVTRRAEHFATSVRMRIDWAAENYARLGYESPLEAITPILHSGAERALDYYWIRNTAEFKQRRDRLLELWPPEVPVPRLLTRLVLPAFLLHLRDRLSFSQQTWTADDLGPSDIEQDGSVVKVDAGN